MDIHVLTWTSMYLHGHPCTYMDIHVLTWTSMYVLTWMSIYLHTYPYFYMDASVYTVFTENNALVRKVVFPHQ
jgi:hypothetical protein